MNTHTRISLPALLASCSLAAVLTVSGNAHALLVHAPATPIGMTVVEPESNVFNASASVDYNEFAINGYWIDAPGAPTGYGSTFSNQHAKIKFTADPGHVLTWIDMDMFYVWRTAYSHGAYSFAGTWSLSDGTYSGPTSWSYNTAGNHEMWDMDPSGRGGSFYFGLEYSWSGGDRYGRRFTGGPILLPNLTEVTLEMDLNGFLLSDSFYGSTLFATLGFADAPPAPLPQDNQVPEPSTLLLALGGLGILVAARPSRRLKRTLDCPRLA